MDKIHGMWKWLCCAVMGSVQPFKASVDQGNVCKGSFCAPDSMNEAAHPLLGQVEQVTGGT